MTTNKPEVVAYGIQIDTALFCDLKTDEEKSTFFLSGRGYETGVVAKAIQNDVAMAYHRCSEYRKELKALQAECALLRKDKARLDWLSDPENAIGNVELPEKAVLENVHCLRAAIDAAMEGGEE